MLRCCSFSCMGGWCGFGLFFGLGFFFGEEAGGCLGLFFIVGECFCLHTEDVRCKKKSCTSNDTSA